ncbi:hypothetical protein K438DRAFT_1980693 [Mycena galopus ATCC 62051]|nr:hypothetical protein K438DRAFT_1980693 [Mycena galopus ATCC 62051]
MAACRRALEIPEIVRVICGEADESSSFEPQTTLVTLARTSKIFTDAALDVVWYEQRSLVPLVKCMPETLWEQRGVRSQGTGVVIHLRRPIISSDLSRFLFYSVRVRELDLRFLSKYGPGRVHSDFLRALDMAMPAQAFPKLADFAWSPKKKDVLSIMRHFLGSRIRKIHIELEDVAMLSILPLAKTSCPHLSEFDLGVSTTQMSVFVVTAVSDAVCGWHHLTDLSIPNLDEAGWTHVSQLPFLTSLSLSFVDDTTSIHVPKFLAGSTFPALESLSIYCTTVRFCIGVIQVISSRRLKSLTIQPMAVWTTSAWLDLHTTLIDCLDHNSLRFLAVEEWHVSGRPADDELAAHVLTPDAIRPLLAFKNLTSITYQIHPCLDVGDEFLEEMAQAWPKLSNLQFGTEVPILLPPRATLKCLISFARHCLRLSTLGIRMDATDIPAFTHLPGDRITSWANYLYVGTSPITITKEGLVAAFISNIFPELQELHPFALESLPEPLGTYATSWIRVGELVPVFSSVRSQEEEFWSAEVSDGDSTAEEVQEVS